MNHQVLCWSSVGHLSAQSTQPDSDRLQKFQRVVRGTKQFFFRFSRRDGCLGGFSWAVGFQNCYFFCLCLVCGFSVAFVWFCWPTERANKIYELDWMLGRLH